MSVLDEIVDGVRIDLAEREAAVPIGDVREAARRAPEAAVRQIAPRSRRYASCASTVSSAAGRTARSTSA